MDIDQTKPCRFCEHYVSQPIGKKYFLIGQMRIGVCKEYKYPPDKSGKVEFKTCDNVRKNPALCGPNGKDFEPTAYSNLKPRISP